LFIEFYELQQVDTTVVSWMFLHMANVKNWVYKTKSVILINLQPGWSITRKLNLTWKKIYQTVMTTKSATFLMLI